MKTFQDIHQAANRIDSSSAQDYEERLSLLTENGVISHPHCTLHPRTASYEYRLAFWVMMGMTISFIGRNVISPDLMGLSINMISMFGFLVVLGIVVDDAIVVGENVYEYRQTGHDLY
ncbi:MAG: efflux RND transporter permease subunit [Fodinibius sp.]|nr:efflux RND transporter permease subunit [Fodinibius sp.]